MYKTGEVSVFSNPFEYAHNISKLVHKGETSASSIIEFYLSRISVLNPKLNAYTHICSERALKKAKDIDNKVAKGQKLGKLAGIPFSVKNLYDIESVVTLAGSKINRTNKPASQDALLIKRLEQEDAILIGALAMGEFAYDFTGENSHYGNCCNPWDSTLMTGGSSSGSGAATSGGLAPISLGSDTNGSIRVPSSLCGIFGLKPTYGRLPRTNTYPFCDSLDHLGPIARSVKDLSLCFDVLQGFDENDHACVKRETINTYDILEEGLNNLRIKIADGYFDCSDFPDAAFAMEKVKSSLNIADKDKIEIPGALQGRSAAYLITNIESSLLHKKHLQDSPEDFDPDTRYRFLAGALLPSEWYLKAQQVRQWYAEQANHIFQDTDVIICPATPCVAPKQGEKKLEIKGEAQPLRPNLGYFTQPISAIGLPSVTVPCFVEEKQLPIGVQIVAAPWREDICLKVAFALEQKGFKALQPTDIS